MSALILALPGGVRGYPQGNDDSTLKGQVILPVDQTGPATILVLTAERKPQTPITARYPNLPERGRTDSRGWFELNSLNSAWQYRVVIIAPGCRPKSFAHVDPAAEPLVAKLEAADADKAPRDTIMCGRVLDPRGRPVSGALIKIQEVTRNGTMYFSADKIDPFAVSDDKGEFMVFGQGAFTECGGAIEASGLATGLFEDWPSGNTVHELRLVDGASLCGRLFHGKTPVAQAEICLDRFGAEAGSFAWNSTSLTDSEGRFAFNHLPPGRSCRLRGLMGALGSLGAVPTRVVRLPENRSTNDIGDLLLEPTFTVEGRIRLPDGDSLPTDSCLFFGNFGMGMSQLFPVAQDGSFRTTGFPAGSLTVYIRVPGYELTPRDASLIGGSLTNITVESNVNGLVITMRPRTTPFPQPR